jgi:tRNA threonylcarbamoyladenosine biosynthesis protein TsaE
VEPLPPPWLRIATRSPEETRAIGESLGGRAFPGAVILLEGPLGAGKTVLARGVAAGLGVESPVTSPSFAILAVHAGRLPFFHLDLYRVNDPAELRAIDLAEIFGAGGVAVVEWPRWLLEDPPPGALEVRIRPSGEGERAIELRARNARWRERLTDLAGVGGAGA